MTSLDVARPMLSALHRRRSFAPLTLRAKITALLVAYFFVALIAIGSTLSISRELEGSAAAINDAGSERMRTYRIAFLLALYVRDPAPALQSEIEREIARFESLAADLEAGDPARPLSLPDTAKVRSQLLRLRREWAAQIRPRAERILSAPTQSGADELAALHRELPRFVDLVNDLVVSIEVSNAHATLLLRSFQIGLVTLALVGTGLLLYLFSVLVIAPVSRLQAGIRRMGAADFGTRLPVRGQDELGELAAGFNQMAAQLQDLYARLEERVAEKTRGLETKSRELATLYDVAAYLNAASGATPLCEGVLQRMVTLFAAQAGVIRLGDAAGAPWRVVATVGGTPELAAEEEQQDPAQCSCGAAAGGAPVNCLLGADQHATHACVRAGGATVVAVAIRSKQRLLGLLTLSFADAGVLPEGEVRLLEAVGQHLGIAIENQRLFAREKEMAVSEERNLLAQELHDSIAQSLAFLNIQVQLLKDALEREQRAEARDGVARIHEGVQQCYDDVRELLVHFRTRVETADLETALRSALEKFGAQTGIAVRFSREGRPADIAPTDVLQILHIAQEALSNVRKHAHAGCVEMRLGGAAQRCTLVIEDDGRGFDPATDGGDTHFGLSIMRERARRAGGAVDIDAAPGRGTRVCLSLPEHAA